MSTLNKLSGVVMMLMSIAFYLNGSMSLVYAVMMIICSFMIFESLDQVGAFNGLIRTIENCVDKANEALSSPTMDIDGKEITPESMTLTVRNVDFSYDTKKIIDGVSFEIPERTTIAFVGPSGGGKTTITQLLARFWDVDSGQILLGGTDIREYSYDSILDEATANVDPENENLLMKAVESLTKKKTVIMIAHRLKTVETADQIFVIDRGKIVQCGKHDELMKEDGIYRRFIGERKEAAGWKIGSRD
ncbi:MAG: ATP-binding cassette domain-containing protein [Ruminococcus sp.]|nr:ATP-binding cassette domain-containing protein [Ruminococcus sp.]